MPFFCLRSFWSTKQAFLPELSSAFVPVRDPLPSVAFSCLFTKDRDPSFLNVVLFIERLRRSLVQFTRKSNETSFILFPHELIVKSRDPLPSVAFSCLFTIFRTKACAGQDEKGALQAIIYGGCEPASVRLSFCKAGGAEYVLIIFW
jgi:hypothetical protein